ncbi:hypothetical protein [Amphritea pacifica]|uniref:Uncharacterized protein n=1 Tax=Amphritea pacifica TaxID=2811233 RepID=A0ABS2W5Q9_9GAMM|nr:hypothetical protein [Amphritea pacifica]MBN0987050.1 hypothetical protein [Amphritea pacifica]MBN1006397.1 hypothetical protein [Amphritea pacifica]
MEFVFLFAYLSLYWAIRINQALTPEDLMLHDERLGHLVIMLLIAMPVVILRVIVGNRYYRKKFHGLYPSINVKNLMQHDISYSALCTIVVGIIYVSERDYFDAGFREFGVSIFIYWFASMLLGFLRWLPATKNGFR